MNAPFFTQDPNSTNDCDTNAPIDQSNEGRMSQEEDRSNVDVNEAGDTVEIQHESQKLTSQFDEHAEGSDVLQGGQTDIGIQSVVDPVEVEKPIGNNFFF